MKLKKIITPVLCATLFATALPAAETNEAKPSKRA